MIKIATKCTSPNQNALTAPPLDFMGQVPDPVLDYMLH